MNFIFRMKRQDIRLLFSQKLFRILIFCLGILVFLFLFFFIQKGFSFQKVIVDSKKIFLSFTPYSQNNVVSPDSVSRINVQESMAAETISPTPRTEYPIQEMEGIEIFGEESSQPFYSIRDQGRSLARIDYDALGNEFVLEIIRVTEDQVDLLPILRFNGGYRGRAAGDIFTVSRRDGSVHFYDSGKLFLGVTPDERYLMFLRGSQNGNPGMLIFEEHTLEGEYFSGDRFSVPLFDSTINQKYSGLFHFAFHPDGRRLALLAFAPPTDDLEDSSSDSFLFFGEALLLVDLLSHEVRELERFTFRIRDVYSDGIQGMEEMGMEFEGNFADWTSASTIHVTLPDGQAFDVAISSQ